MRWPLRALLLVMASLAVQTAGATVFDPSNFSNPEEAARYKVLTEELRCLVCQNQSLADSNAELAADLRQQIHTMITSGASNQDILDFMVARYGDFVLYRPPLRSSTFFLWAGPFILALVGLTVLVIIIRGRNQTRVQPELSDTERKHLAQLLRSASKERT